MRYAREFGPVSRRDRHRADLFYESLTGVRVARRRALPRSIETYETYEHSPEQPQPQPQPQPAPAPAPAQQQPYLPPGGRAFVPQAGTFNCSPPAFVVVPASFLPERTGDTNAAIDAALTAAGLDAAQRRRIVRAGLAPIAAEFGGPALTELLARLRWSADDIVRWGRRADRMLVQRLLIHIPGHFRELARRAPDAREAFMLECLGWLLMAHIRRAVANATRNNWWVPPPPAFVTVVPNPVPPASAGVQQLFLRYLLMNTTMTADQWNAKLVEWGRSLAGRQWQAEVGAPQPGRPFYASLAAIPAHVNTAATRATFNTAWNLRVADTDAAHPPDPANAPAVTLEGLRNAVALRSCDNANAHLPAGMFVRVGLQGLELVEDFPRRGGTQVTQLTLLQPLRDVYTALFQAIRELGWNDLLYQTSGGACFRGTKQRADVPLVIGGVQVTVNPFHQPDATTVTRINTLFTPQQRARVVAKERLARTISEHGLGAAIDFNVQENEQAVAARPFGSMDPRIVAIFEAFHFRFGGCFNQTDPMHFDYCQAACAPAAAAAGALGPVVTPRMLLPVQATDRVLA